MASPSGVELPCPGVSFGGDLVGRLERLSHRLSAARQLREGAGGSQLVGAGEEFVGYRPYRPGEDLRRLDWDLFARLDRPYVRVTRREAAEHWSIHLDASASMGVGPPGKLQAAAELTAALACLGLRARATVRIVAGAGATVAELVARRPTDLPALIAFLESRRAQGTGGLGLSLRERPPDSTAGRVFLVGDLLDLEPADAACLAGGGRAVTAAMVLAPLELTPEPGGGVEWADAEGGERLARALTPEAVARYEQRLEAHIEAWSRLAARRGFGFACVSSERPFEEVVRQVLGG